MGSNLASLDLRNIDGTTITSRAVCSAWRRFVAYEVDRLILFCFGALVGKLFFDQLARLGLWGPLAGSCVALIYDAFFDSKIGNGQTLGKRCLKIRVIDSHGDTISLAKSFLRSVILLTPVFLLKANLPESRTSWGSYSHIVVIVLLVGCFTSCLIIFNPQTRQGLHDLAVGSYVVHADHSGRVETMQIGKTRWIILGTLFVLAVATVEVSLVKFEMTPPFPQMRRDVVLIEQVNGVRRAYIRDKLSHDSFGGGAKKRLTVSVSLKSSALNQEAFAGDIARNILQNDRNAQSYDQIDIKFLYGYDITIARNQREEDFVHSPAEWLQLEHGVLPEQSPYLTQP